MTITDEQQCEECGGRTVNFRGNSRWNLEYKVCSRWEEPGHLTKKEIQQAIAREGRRVNPSGRWA